MTLHARPAAISAPTSSSSSSLTSPSQAQAQAQSQAHTSTKHKIQPSSSASASGGLQHSSSLTHKSSPLYQNRIARAGMAGSPSFPSSSSSLDPMAPTSASLHRHASTGSTPTPTPSADAASGSPDTSPSSPGQRARRKPVPSIVPPPPGPISSAHTLPASHPFANAHPSPSPRTPRTPQSPHDRGFAAALSANGNGRASPALGSPASTIASELDTPGIGDEKELFYRPPTATGTGADSPTPRTGGPLPPPRGATAHRRSPSGRVAVPEGAKAPTPPPRTTSVALAQAQAQGSLESTPVQVMAVGDRRGTFDGGLNIHIPTPELHMGEVQGSGLRSGGKLGRGQDAASVVQDAHADDDAASFTSSVESAPGRFADARTNGNGSGNGSGAPTSPLPGNASYYNRSLPALPPGASSDANGSTTSLGMMSILGSGPGPGDADAPGDRKDSAYSTMTGLSSIAAPRDVGRSTTTLDMFSALADGPAGAGSSNGARTERLGSAPNSSPGLATYSDSVRSGSDSGSGANKENANEKRPGMRSKTSFFARRGARRALGQGQVQGQGQGQTQGAAEKQVLGPMPVLTEADESGSGELPDEDDFSISRPVSRRRVWEAGQMYVRDEEGRMVRFADLLPVWDGDSAKEVRTVSKHEAAVMARSTTSLPLPSGVGVGAPAPAPGSPGLGKGGLGSLGRGKWGGSVRSGGAPAKGSRLRESFSADSQSHSQSRPSTSTSTSSASDGIRLRDALADGVLPQPKTVIFFIRTFYCGQCQDYTLASIATIDRAALARDNIRLVVISNGNWRHIKPYRELFKCPFPIYVDSSRNLYRAMGMSRSSVNPGPLFRGRAAYNQKSVPRQWVQSAVTAVKQPKVNPGNLFQLGGEFVFEPGFECVFAHRMTNFSNHMEAADVLRIAGVDAPELDPSRAGEGTGGVLLSEAQIREADRLEEEMRAWREQQAVLEGEGEGAEGDVVVEAEVPVPVEGDGSGAGSVVVIDDRLSGASANGHVALGAPLVVGQTGRGDKVHGLDVSVSDDVDVDVDAPGNAGETITAAESKGAGAGEDDSTQVLEPSKT